MTKDLIDKFSILNEVKYFPLGIFQNYLVFIPAKKYIEYFSGTTRIISWKSNGISQEDNEYIAKSESNSSPAFVDHPLSTDRNFNRHSLINIISIPKEVINLYISCTLGPQLGS